MKKFNLLSKDRSLVWLGFVGMLYLVTGALVAYGATYNLYFNNTEQGDHAVANPQVTISDGKVVQSNGSAEVKNEQGAVSAAAGAKTPEPVASVAPTFAAKEVGTEKVAEQTPAAVTAGSTDAQAAAVTPESKSSLSRFWDGFTEKQRPQRSHLRLTASGIGVGQKVNVTSYDYGVLNLGNTTSRNYTRDVVKAGGLLQLGLMISKDVGFNFYGGAYDHSDEPSRYIGGGELEITPIHLSMFGLEDFVELGVMVGASTIRRSSLSPVTLHGGARLSFNFHRFALTGGARANKGYYMGEAGLAFYL